MSSPTRFGANFDVSPAYKGSITEGAKGNIVLTSTLGYDILLLI